jgi:hypothetical protein
MHTNYENFENMKERDHLRDLGVDGKKIILKWMLNK